MSGDADSAELVLLRYLATPLAQRQPPDPTGLGEGRAILWQLLAGLAQARGLPARVPAETDWRHHRREFLSPDEERLRDTDDIVERLLLRRALRSRTWTWTSSWTSTASLA